MNSNIEAVPARRLMDVKKLSGGILEVMRDELHGELSAVFPELRKLAAKRNGLEVITRELARRDVYQFNASEQGEDLTRLQSYHGKGDCASLPAACSIQGDG